MKETDNRSTIINAYTDFVKCFGPNYFDKSDNKADDKADDKVYYEQPDTTDMPKFES